MSSQPAFRLERRPLEHRPRAAAVSRIEDVTPSYRRITLEGDFEGFDSPGADDHLRIFLVPDDAVIEGEPAERIERMREHPSREYTPVAWDAGSLTLDFVIYGTGPASDWAANAVIGSRALIGGPRGSLVLEGAPEWWLLVGDRTALPAIRRHLGAVRPGAPVDVLLVAEDPADEQPLETRGVLTARWLRSQEELVAALGSVPVHEGDGFAFIAAEQSIVAPGRAFLTSRGVDLDRAVIKGYWKHA